MVDFDYNSSRTKLILPEYGRNIQNMVQHCKGIADREERNRAARAVITVMGNMNPHLRDIADFKHKLWDHLAIMADFELDIDAPYETPALVVLKEKPKIVPYTTNTTKYRHYGKIIELFIKKAAELPEGEERDTFIASLANHLKKLYLTWNRESVTDELIFKDLETMSGGKIKVRPDLRLSEVKDILSAQKKRPIINKNRPIRKKI